MISPKKPRLSQIILPTYSWNGGVPKRGTIISLANNIAKWFACGAIGGHSSNGQKVIWNWSYYTDPIPILVPVVAELQLYTCGSTTRIPILVVPDIVGVHLVFICRPECQFVSLGDDDEGAVVVVSWEESSNVSLFPWR